LTTNTVSDGLAGSPTTAPAAAMTRPESRGGSRIPLTRENAPSGFDPEGRSLYYLGLPDKVTPGARTRNAAEPSTRGHSYRITRPFVTPATESAATQAGRAPTGGSARRGA
jgi:hypothetical protein